MRSSPAVAMSDTLKITIVIVVLGLQLVTFWIAGSVDTLVNFFTNFSDAPPAIEQISQLYQPPSSIGSPSRTIGSGTR
ncbi:MAG: hypothetical protein N4J56_003659 [Chroococcidiopsis sp. SAG 2025]|uniref:hypothetical protein n=1 Tax=Chroococcidiopsis sp. SAG 2025 TaxID=171389 RepID=UPI0029373B20|nr:hypothetical protein [Chroococcidiopsis sp. SAG 2025]MDV2994005.1 hypothetical protein [Chroococcidiopsis sp. SAG 2025]